MFKGRHGFLKCAISRLDFYFFIGRVGYGAGKAAMNDYTRSNKG